MSFRSRIRCSISSLTRSTLYSTTTAPAGEWGPVTNANAVAATPAPQPQGNDVVGAITSAIRKGRPRKTPTNNRSKRHARDFELEERDDEWDEDEDEEPAGPFPTAMPQEIGKRCSGLDHGCEMTEEQLFK